jgi:hypothetical protein
LSVGSDLAIELLVVSTVFGRSYQEIMPEEVLLAHSGRGRVEPFSRLSGSRTTTSYVQIGDLSAVHVTGWEL